MKRITSYIAALFILAFLIPFNVNAADETYALDEHHTYVEFHIKHMGFSVQSGKWYITKGTITLDKNKPQDSKLEVSIDVAKLATGHAELDKHLKDKLFFDVEHYPVATFISNKIVMNGKTKAKVTGNLTLHGVTKPVTLDVTLNKEGVSLITDRMTLGFSATTTIKRSDFGIKTGLPGVEDDVKLNIEVEAALPKA